MIRAAELFVQSEQVLVEVVGRIRGAHWVVVLPPLLDVPGADEPADMRAAVNRAARDDAWVPELLTGATPDARHDGDLLGGDPLAAVVRYSEAARVAAGKVDDDEPIVRSGDRDLPASDYLWELTIAHSFLAHEIAMQLGSRACPFTEELARGMCEGTAPRADHWRSIGFFREPLPLPADVSWRDRFLLCAGRDPHALEDRV
jgi:hypothetical protein